MKPILSVALISTLATAVILCAQPASVFADNAKKRTASAAKATRLGLTTQDEIPIYDTATSDGKSSKTLYKNVILKIIKGSPGDKRFHIESEFGSGWVPSESIRLDFDRNGVYHALETGLDMAWFFERFNQGTNYETMSFEGEQFTVDQYRSLIKAAKEGSEEERRASQVVLARTIFPGLDTEDPKALYFKKILLSEEFWLNVDSRSQEFWKLLPKKIRNNASFLTKAIPHGAFLIYDQLSKEMRERKDLAMLAFSQMPELLEFASEQLRDDEELVTIAGMVNPLVVTHASARLKDKDEIFKKIAPINAMAIQFASDRLKNSPELITQVCSFRPWALQYASKQVLDTESVFLALASRNPMVIKLASERLKNNAELLKKMYQATPENYKRAFYNWLPANLRHHMDS